MSTGPKEPRHNIAFLGAKLVNLSFGGYQGASFHERAEKTDVTGIVACFRNEAVYGETIKPVRAARAHLKFFDSEGKEIGAGFSRGFWLEEKVDLFDLIPGGGTGCVVVILASDQKITVPSKHRANTSWGETIKDEFEDMEKLPHICEISLLDSNNQLVLQPIRLELSGTKPTLGVKLLFPPLARPVEAAAAAIVRNTLDDVSAQSAGSASSAPGPKATGKKPWTRDQIIALVVGILTAIAIVVAIATPEIRRKIGLEKAVPATLRKPTAEEGGPPFLVSVEWAMFSYGGGNHGTPFWFQYRSPAGCTLSPVQALLFIHIKNRRNVPVTIIGYSVEAGFTLTRLPTTSGNIYSILPPGKSLLGAKIGDVVNFSQGPGFSMVHFSNDDADFTHAMRVEMEAMDNLLNKPLEPNVPIRGWSFFTYSSEKNFSLAGTLRINIKTDDLQTSSYEFDMKNPDSQWDVLKRPMKMQSVSDLSNCKREYYSLP